MEHWAAEFPSRYGFISAGVGVNSLSLEVTKRYGQSSDEAISDWYKIASS